MNFLALAMQTGGTDGPIAPTRLLRDAQAAAGVSGWVWPEHAGAWAAGVTVGLVLIVLARRWWRRHCDDPVEVALRLIGARLGLTRDERGLIARLAEARRDAEEAPATRVGPLALLLSQDAFIGAAELAAGSGKKWAAREALAALHRKVFEPRPGDV